MTGGGPRCSIQPAGFLLALSEDWVIAAISANIGDYVDCVPAALIGRSASELLAEDAVHALRNRLALLRDPEGVERLLALTQAGLSREDSYALVQRHAMKVWQSDGALSLLDLLRADRQVTDRLSSDELDSLFDLGYHLRRIDAIFERVFG